MGAICGVSRGEDKRERERERERERGKERGENREEGNGRSIWKAIYSTTHATSLPKITPHHTTPSTLTSIGGSGLLAMSSASYLDLMKGSASCSNRSAANPSCFTCKCFLRKSKPYRDGKEKGMGRGCGRI
jgi:hypothetical protein